MLWTFLDPKNYNYFKSPFKHLKIIIKKIPFVIFCICLIASFEPGNGNKCYFHYHPNIHILNQFLTTLKNDFENGF
jgi:hypothetical protein